MAQRPKVEGVLWIVMLNSLGGALLSPVNFPRNEKRPRRGRNECDT